MPDFPIGSRGPRPRTPTRRTNDHGKVFHSVHETSSNSTAITPQEYVLLYVILEVGVCTNFPPDVK